MQVPLELRPFSSVIFPVVRYVNFLNSFELGDFPSTPEKCSALISFNTNVHYFFANLYLFDLVLFLSLAMHHYESNNKNLVLISLRLQCHPINFEVERDHAASL